MRRILIPAGVYALMLAGCGTDYEFGADNYNIAGEDGDGDNGGPGDGSGGGPDDPNDPDGGDGGGDNPGDGSGYDAGFDLFEVTDNISDIIIYGDTSDSMSEELQTMGANITTFVDRLADNATDWHIMAVTGPTGCAVNGWMDESTPNFQQQFADAIITKPANESEDEMGLQNTTRAAQKTDPGDCNDGFLRPNALLHVIYLSDENDESPNFQSAGYWADYADDISDVKGSAGLVRFSAVAGPVPGGCNGADPGEGYDEIVDAFNGAFISICDDWANELDHLADLSNGQSVFPLSDEPVPGTIRVWVNGSIRTNWKWEPTLNQVTFPTNPPDDGDTVEIEYDVAV